MKSAQRLTALMLCIATLALGGCKQPPRDMPDASVIRYNNHAALPPDCNTLARPSELSDAGMKRPDMQWGCATYTNLAAQLAHPEEIVKPEKLGPADAAVAANAALRYQTEHVTPLDPSTSRDAH
jgi:pilus assembly protein CpaD